MARTEQMESPSKEVAAVWVSIADLKPWADNPRDNESAVAGVADSIKRFGFASPIIARKADGEVIAGHTRLKAAIKLGLTQVPVRYMDLDPADAHLLALADNKVAEVAEWDAEGLAEVLRELAEGGADLEGLGWSDEELAGLLGDTPEPLGETTGDDDVPEAGPEPESRLGEVYQLGPHRLVCGDSTDAGAWSALMGGEKARMVWTDPPYGIAYKPMRGGKDIANDASPEEAYQVTVGALSMTVGAEAHFVCCDWRSMPVIWEAMAAVGLDVKACIVWDKQRRVQNLDRFAKRHEMILYAGPYGGQKTVDDDIWCASRDFIPDHPTPKPVSLVSLAIRYASHPGEVVVDTFGGSGSTLIAAAKEGRIARVIELDPKYCDVIRRRWTKWARENGQEVGDGGLE